MKVSNLKYTSILGHLSWRNEVCLQGWEDDILHHPPPWLLLIESGVYGTRTSGGSCFAFRRRAAGVLSLFRAVQEEGVMLSAVEVSTLLSKCLETLFLRLPFHLSECMNTIATVTCIVYIEHCVHVCLCGGGTELTSVASLTRKSGSLSRFGE